jgi:hypothetical protein
MTFIRTRGTLETPTTVQTDDNLGDLLFGGASSDGSIAYGGGVFAFADGTTTVGGVPTRLSFVTGSHSGNRAERLKIGSSGAVTVTSTLGVTGETTLNGDLNLTKVTPAIVLTNNVNTAKSRISVYSVTPNSVYTTANAYFDGSNWQRDDTAVTSVVKSLDAGSATVLERFRYSAAGSGAITLSTAYQVNTGGVFQVPKLGAIANSTTAMQFFKADGTTAVMTIDTTTPGIKLAGTVTIKDTVNNVTRVVLERGVGQAAGSKLMSVMSGATEYAYWRADGLFAGSYIGTKDDYAVQIVDSTAGGTLKPTGIALGSTATLSFGSGAWYAAKDVGISRVSSSTLGIGDGQLGTSNGSLKLAYLHALATTEQLRLGYDASNYLSATIGSTGSATLALTGTTPTFTFSQGVTFSDGITVADAKNIALNTTTGTKIGTAVGQKLAFWNATPVSQQAHIADATGGATVDTEARAAIASINALLATLGLTAAS